MKGRKDIPIASPGLTISMTIPIVSDVLLGEWGVFAENQSHPIMEHQPT
jgi:hypothetical protein